MDEITLEDIKRLRAEELLKAKSGDHVQLLSDDVDVSIVVSGLDPARARPMLPRYLA